MSFVERLIAKFDLLIVKFILWYLKDNVPAPIETHEISIYAVKHIRACCIVAMIMPIGGLAVVYSLWFLPELVCFGLYIWLILLPILGIRDTLKALRKQFEKKMNHEGIKI